MSNAQIRRHLATTKSYAVMAEALCKGASVATLVELSGVHENTARKFVACCRGQKLKPEPEKLLFCYICRWEPDKLGRKGFAMQPVYRIAYGYDAPRPRQSAEEAKRKKKEYLAAYYQNGKKSKEASAALAARLQESESRVVINQKKESA